LGTNQDHFNLTIMSSISSQQSQTMDKAARFLMTAMPAGLPSSKKLGSRKATKLAKDGQSIGSVYNIVAARPQPSLTRLEQSITVTLGYPIQSAITTSIVANTYGAYSFALSNFSDNAQYIALFDQYRFDQIEVWLSPANALASGGNYVTAVDLDDANVPTTYSSVESKQGSITSGVVAAHYHKWKPHTAIAAYSGSFTSYSNQVAGWIDSASPNVAHFALKYAIQSTPGATVLYNFEARAVISFRAPGIA
jgi:hypothetical protein